MFSTILAAILPASFFGTVVQSPAISKTLDNLQSAFNGESNAHVRYAAFAKVADSEGHGEVASLFRAASKAEEIHAANHARVIREMGAEPEASIEPTIHKSTRENLQAAIDGEIYERDTMYPSFLELARAEKNSAAVKTFNYALKTEAEHARLYADALKHLDSLRGTGKEYFVCTHCGYTVESLNFLKCLVCGHSKDDYLSVS